METSKGYVLSGEGSRSEEVWPDLVLTVSESGSGIESDTGQSTDSSSPSESISGEDSENDLEALLQDQSVPQDQAVYPSVNRRRQPGEDVFVCIACNKKYDSLRQLKHHMKLHTDETRFRKVCLLCNITFDHAPAFRIHMKCHVVVIISYQCPECAVSFEDKSAYLAHMSMHPGYPGFVCGVCSKTLSSKHAPDKHVQKAHLDKPFHCPKCAKTFCSKDDLTRHIAMKIHKEDISFSYSTRRQGSSAKLPSPSMSWRGLASPSMSGYEPKTNPAVQSSTFPSTMRGNSHIPGYSLTLNPVFQPVTRRTNLPFNGHNRYLYPSATTQAIYYTYPPVVAMTTYYTYPPITGAPLPSTVGPAAVKVGYPAIPREAVGQAISDQSSVAHNVENWQRGPNIVRSRL